jgi:type I restriction enzyme, S subunit
VNTVNPDALLRHFARVTDRPGAIRRLRALILDLAVRGKLVPQDASDGDASSLLDRISVEKARLHQAGELQRIKDFPVVDRPPFSIPPSWSWVRIREVATDRGQAIPEAPFTYIDVTAIDKERGVVREPKVLASKDAPSRARKIARRGDVLYSCVRPYLLNVAVIDVEYEPAPIVSTAFAVLNGMGLVLPQYIWVVLRSPPLVVAVEQAMRGQAYPAINDSDFGMLPFPLPPLAEQRRVVAKVDELMVLCDRLEAARAEREAVRDRLTAASLARLNSPDPETISADARFAIGALPSLLARPDQVKQLRQTFLSLAVRGVLVAQDSRDEPALALLLRIANEKAGGVAAGRARSRSALSPVDVEQAPFNLPPGWAWARFPELGLFGRGKSKHRPRNDPALFVDGSHLVIQTGDVARSGGVIRTYTSKYNDTGLAQSQKWPAGTLCITIAANIADSGILAFDACFPDSVVGFIPSPILEDARYIEYFVRTAKASLLEFAPATAQKNINLEILEAVLVPLPPLNEQRRIVARLDELMAICEQLERSLAAGEHASARLLDALVHEALEPAEEEFV